MQWEAKQIKEVSIIILLSTLLYLQLSTDSPSSRSQGDKITTRQVALETIFSLALGFYAAFVSGMFLVAFFTWLFGTENVCENATQWMVKVGSAGSERYG